VLLHMGIIFACLSDVYVVVSWMKSHRAAAERLMLIFGA
jgi:hypothetical protein